MNFQLDTGVPDYALVSQDAIKFLLAKYLLYYKSQGVDLKIDG